ncbi:MAG: YitT family protein [Bacteroidales bacterium]|nr:YitT family protein [Bacteroidales bacterium]
MSFKSVTDYLKTKKFWVEFLLMTFGMILTAICVHYFLVPSKLIIGTISGLSIVLATVSETLFSVHLEVSVMIFVINAILLVLAYFLIGKEFGIKTVYTALILGPFTGILEKFLPYQKVITMLYHDKSAFYDAATGGWSRTALQDGINSLMGDPWFDLVCFVLILSFAQAMLFKINASTGGLDILAKIVNKYMHFDIGASVTVAGTIICLTAFAINPFNIVVIGLIGTWINGLVVDYFTAGMNRRKRVCIISPQYHHIQDFIINELHRGVTMYDVTGGYSNQKKVEIQALLTKDEFSDLMNHINENGINAFITAGNVSEVYGLWASNKKNTKHERAKL